MKKTIKKRAFVSAIAMLIVSAIVLTSSTFAWFSMAKTGTVEMDLTIASPDGIQISANTTAFTTALTMADLTGESGSRYAAYSGNINCFPTELAPVSSTLNCSKGLPTFYYGQMSEPDSNGKSTLTLSAINSEANNGYFVAFDLFIQLAVDKTVKFDRSTIECTENPEVVTAMRIATVNCGLVSKGADADTIKGKVPSAVMTSGVRNAMMLEPNASQHTAIAIEKAKGGSVPATGYINKSGSGLTCDTKFPNIVPSGLGYSAGTEAGSDCSIKAAAGISRIRVYIWMEGQDADCANDVAGAALKVNLAFDI